MSNLENKEKILVIRMLELGDVLAVAVPLLRHLSIQRPSAELHCLTYGKGQEIINVAVPKAKIMCLEQDQWPDNILQAMEVFLGLAEDMIGQAFSKIINLDTSFMACFLARFLKDAGEPVVGNYLSISIPELIDQIQQQTLQQDYVHNESLFMSSTFYGMDRWHRAWWEERLLPDCGYAEFYLKHCCGYSGIDFDISMPINNQLGPQKTPTKTIVLSTTDPSVRMTLTTAQKKLVDSGFEVEWLNPNASFSDTLHTLKSADLLVATPGAEHWYALSVGCPELLICGEMDPRILMPDFATDIGVNPSAQALVESIESIFAENEHA